MTTATRELATKGDLLELERRLIKWVGCMAVSQTAIILAVMALLCS